MSQEKLYKDMTPAEQLEYATQFSNFKNDALPLLCTLGDAWEQAHLKSYEVGLRLLNSFPVAREFVKDSFFFGDYSRRVTLIEHYVGLVETEIAAGRAVTTPQGDKIVQAPPVQPTTARRGRPTKAEQAAKAEATGTTPASPNLFAANAEGSASNESPIATTNAEGSAGNESPIATANAEQSAANSALIQAIDAQLGNTQRLHLDQLTAFLTPSIAKAIPTIAGIRGAAAHAAEQAKLLAAQGASVQVVQPHSEEVCRLKEQEAAIYLAIDTELSNLCLHLSIDPNYAGWKVRLEEKGKTLADIMPILQPYYDKMNEDGVLDAKKAELQAAMAAEAQQTTDEPTLTPEQEAERKKALKRIRGYMRRADVTLSQNRIDTMKKYIAEAETLGEDVSAYNLILNKAIEDFAALNTNQPTEE